MGLLLTSYRVMMMVVVKEDKEGLMQCPLFARADMY